MDIDPLTMHPRLSFAAAAIALCLPTQALAAEERAFNVPKGSLSAALPLISRQAGVSISVGDAKLWQARVKPVRGRMSVEKASRRLLDGALNESPVDGFVRNRAGQSLSHVFTLLSLILPSQPLQIAFQSLQSENSRLRGTALEYLEGVLPTEVREQVWPYLVEGRPTRAAQPHDEVIANLLRSSSSVTLQGLAVATPQ